jgi:triosephosphate isomerase
MRKFFVGGNWKMNGSVAENEKLLQTLNTMKFNQSSTGSFAYVKGKFL